MGARLASLDIRRRFIGTSATMAAAGAARSSSTHRRSDTPLPMPLATRIEGGDTVPSPARAGYEAIGGRTARIGVAGPSRRQVLEAGPARYRWPAWPSNSGAHESCPRNRASPGVLPALARRVLAICHYDPDTLEDRGAHRCGRACYECLPDYGNQPDHQILDRAPIRDVLAELARAECRPAGGAGSRAERLAALRKRCDSRLEQRWLDMVGSMGLRLPSDAQYAIPGHRTRPDFFYLPPSGLSPNPRIPFGGGAEGVG